MKRMTRSAAIIVALAACQAGETGPDVEYHVVVDDAAGDPITPALSPDGTRVAYARAVEGRAGIFVANVDGSEPAQLTHGVWDRNPTWSPDGKWIAYVAEAPDFDIFVISSAGGEPRQLTSGPGHDLPGRWLPDGSAIEVYRESGGVYKTLAVSLDGGAERPLGSPMEGSQYVAVSPDGSKMAFDLHRGGEGTIWVQDMNGGAPRQLTTEGLENATPTSNMWSPDGRHIAYVSRATGTWDIWIADVETGERHQLTSDIHNDRDYAWSPDGRWIAFRSDRGGQWDLWIVPAAGGQAMRVTDDLALETASFGNLPPQWSPDGRTLYYLRTEIDYHLQVMPVGGGAPRVLAGWSGYTIADVVVSPDGRTALFESDRSGNWDLWSVPIEGGEPAPFAASPLDDANPQFSPDGSQVVFQSSRAGSWDLWVMPAAGGDARQLTDWPAGEGRPQWSPDGTKIAFTSDRDATAADVWVIPAAGGAATRLTTGAGVANNTHLAWARDGRSIYYIGAGPAGTTELYSVSATGGRPRALGANSHIGSGSLSPDGSQYAYSTFIGGWAFLEVIPTTGGAARRLSTRSDAVYQPLAVWSPDGSRMAVSDYDYANDAQHVLMVTWPQGDWSVVTDAAPPSEIVHTFTPDGAQLLVTAFTESVRIMSASVAALVGGGTE